MKTFCSITIIALIAQVIMAANIGRVKRADEVETAMRDLLKLGAHLIDLGINIGDALVEHMPESEEYASHRHDISEFLKVAKAVKAEEGNCVLKVFTALKAMSELFAKYDDENEVESEETSKALEELFAKYGGEEFEKEAKDFFEKYFTQEFLEKVENYKEDSIEKWTVFEEVC